MNINKLCIAFFSVIAFYSHADNDPQFSDYPIKVSSGPFVKSVSLNDKQQHTESWKELIQAEILKPVNFSGHYRVAISKNGKLPKDCGNDGWVCGWVIDKLTGKVVSELPEFNNNTKYFSSIDNGTPSPDPFDMEIYPNSSMIWISGQNSPKNQNGGDVKCANTAYEFKNNNFKKLISARCEIDVGGDSNADTFLP